MRRWRRFVPKRNTDPDSNAYEHADRDAYSSANSHADRNTDINAYCDSYSATEQPAHQRRV